MTHRIPLGTADLSYGIRTSIEGTIYAFYTADELLDGPDFHLDATPAAAAPAPTPASEHHEDVRSGHGSGDAGGGGGDAPGAARRGGSGGAADALANHPKEVEGVWKEVRRLPGSVTAVTLAADGNFYLGAFKRDHADAGSARGCHDSDDPLGGDANASDGTRDNGPGVITITIWTPPQGLPSLSNGSSGGGGSGSSGGGGAVVANGVSSKVATRGRAELRLPRSNDGTERSFRVASMTGIQSHVLHVGNDGRVYFPVEAVVPYTSNGDDAARGDGGNDGSRSSSSSSDEVGSGGEGVSEDDGCGTYGSSGDSSSCSDGEGSETPNTQSSSRRRESGRGRGRRRRRGNSASASVSVQQRVLVWDTSPTSANVDNLCLDDTMLHAIPLYMAPYNLVGPIGLSPENTICFQCYIPALGSEADHGSYGVVAL